MDSIDEAWAKVEAEWGDQEAHRRFIAVCVALDQLPEAGKRYRSVRDSNSEHSEDAGKRIGGLISLATQQLTVTRTEHSTEGSKRTLTWVAFFIMMLMMGSVVFFVSRGGP